MVSIGLILIAAFALGSLFYVYQYRGEARYAGVSEYLRKGWPIATPLNCILYLFTQKRAAKAVPDVNDFPELAEIKKNWEVIKAEALALYQNKYLEQTNKPENDSYYDLGFRTFYKYGWSKFYLTWYGHSHNSAKKLCPKTVAIVNQIPTVNGAMFSILPPGSQLTRHLDPVACSLRYHLGLWTPNDDKCFINVDGKQLSWRDGEAFMFDETYLHYAKNNTDQPRLILMCDIDRPTTFLGTIFNFFYKGVLRMSVVPNMEGDKKGAINWIFSSLAPILAKTKSLKQTNLFLYKIIKYTVNTILAFLVLITLYSVLKFLANLFA